MNPITFDIVGSRILIIFPQTAAFSAHPGTYFCERMKAQPLHSHTKIFFRKREQGVGVIPKIKQSHVIVIWLPR
jgi:hypothetical protein